MNNKSDWKSRSRAASWTQFASWVAVCAAVAQVCGQPLSTGTLVQNTNQPAFPSVPVVESNAWQAATFMTGVNASQLTSVSLDVRTYLWSGGDFWVMVYGDNNGVPGTMLGGGRLNGPSTPNSSGYLTYSATQPLTLAPDTPYWVVAASDYANINGNYGWAWSANTVYTSSVGWGLLPEASWSPDEGTSWNSYSVTGEPGPLLLAVNGYIIPEPSVTALLTLGMAALIVWQSRRARSPA
jgi:hypothetical protein